jgi:N-acyl-D-aspartate/D-glutamate deacylase
MTENSTRIDVLIRGGTLVDGTGSRPVSGDVAIAGNKIVEVGGKIEASGAEVIDADGAVVAPGWVDIHTHYDGQVAWDDTLDPSFSNGVTTFVMGNCGVGFAPYRDGDEQALISRVQLWPKVCPGVRGTRLSNIWITLANEVTPWILVPSYHTARCDCR